MVITAAYIFLVIRRVFFGNLPIGEIGKVEDVSVLDKLAIGLLCAIMFGLGIFPSMMAPMVQSGVQSILALVGGA